MARPVGSLSKGSFTVLVRDLENIVRIASMKNRTSDLARLVVEFERHLYKAIKLSDPSNISRVQTLGRALSTTARVRRQIKNEYEDKELFDPIP